MGHFCAFHNFFVSLSAFADVVPSIDAVKVKKYAFLKKDVGSGSQGSAPCTGSFFPCLASWSAISPQWDFTHLRMTFLSEQTSISLF
jgi:hypothetical protein